MPRLRFALLVLLLQCSKGASMGTDVFLDQVMSDLAQADLPQIDMQRPVDIHEVDTQGPDPADADMPTEAASPLDMNSPDQALDPIAPEPSPDVSDAIEDAAPAESLDLPPDSPIQCAPGHRSCEGTLLRTCANDGSGYVSTVDCDDHNACTTGDGCEGTSCKPTEPLDCDDHDQCTTDWCDPSSGCTHTPLDQVPCDDQDPCTEGDMCSSGICLGNARNCDDNNPCTDDFCATVLGCAHEPNNQACDDLDPCTTGDVCFMGACVGKPCPEGCTCDQGTCICPMCKADGDCDDSLACTEDLCVAGVCMHSPSTLPGCCGASCDDDDPCTADACGQDSTCVHKPIPGPGCCSPAVFAEDFEESPAFTLDPLVFNVGWQYRPFPGTTSMALWYGDAEDKDYANGLANVGKAVSPPVALPAQSEITFAFKTWIDTENGAGSDRFTVYALTSDRTFELWARPVGFPMKTPVPVKVDISPFAGMKVRFAFSFDTVDQLNNSGGGVYVDDVTVSATCKRKPCLIGQDCTTLGLHGWCQEGGCDYDQGIRVEGTLEPSNPELLESYGVAASSDGLFVSDRDNNRILVITVDGNVLRTFGEDGQLNKPRGVALAKDRLFIADSGNNSVVAFTPLGIFLYRFGGQGTDPGRMSEPRGIGVSPDGARVYVADTGNHRVQVFTSQGGLLFVFGGYGKKDGQFRTPSCVAMALSGQVLICDTQNNRISVFGPEGQFIKHLKPTGPMALLNPYGAAVRWDGLVAISDSYNHRILLLDTTGKPLDYFGSGPADLSYPMGLAWTPSGRLAVCEGKRVQLLGFGPP